MKKAAGQMRNGLPGTGQDKDTVTTVQKVREWHPGQLKIGHVNIIVGLQDKTVLQHVPKQLKTELSHTKYILFCRVHSQKVAGSNLAQHAIQANSPGMCG